MKKHSIGPLSDNHFVLLEIRIAIIIAALLILSILFVQPASAQIDSAELGVLEIFTAAPGALVQIPVSIRNVNDLYGLDFILEYDPMVLQIVDVDPADEGLQAALGDFLDPGLLLYNGANNEEGTYRFAMSQVNPSEPKSGDGNVVILTFKVVGDGETTLELSYVKLGNREGLEIPSVAVNGLFVVNKNAPTQVVTYQVVDATRIIQIQTFTPTPTASPVPTKTPYPTVTVSHNVDVLKDLSSSTESNIVNLETQYWLVKNWWMLLVLLALVITLGAYMVKTKSKKSNEEEMNNEK